MSLPRRLTFRSSICGFGILILAGVLPAPAVAATQVGHEELEYASALHHTLRRADGVTASTTTLLAMRADGTGWIQMRMCTTTGCDEIFDTLTSSEYWRGPDEQTVEFYLQADIVGLGWADVAIGNIATEGGGYHSINRSNQTWNTAQAIKLEGWVTEAVNHSSSVWGPWQAWGSGQSFNAYRSEVAWVWV